MNEALTLARQRELDLVEVQPNGQIPVAKIMDLAKFAYREKKIERKKHANKAGKVKEIRFALLTFVHDLQVKAERAQEFLEKGYKVRVSIKLRRFEQGRKEEVKNKIKDFLGFVSIPFAFDQKPLKTPMGYAFIIRKEVHHVKNVKNNSKEIQDNKERESTVSPSGN